MLEDLSSHIAQRYTIVDNITYPELDGYVVN